MKQIRIKEIFDKYSYEEFICDCELEDDCDCELENKMEFCDFISAIKQIEKELKLEWLKEVKTKLDAIADNYDLAGSFYEYRDEIKNKIKELEK